MGWKDGLLLAMQKCNIENLKEIDSLLLIAEIGRRIVFLRKYTCKGPSFIHSPVSN